MPRAKSPSPGIGRPLSDLRASLEARADTTQAAIDAVLHAQVKLIEAMGELAETTVMMAQLLAHPPTRTRDVAETLAHMGMAQRDGRGSEMARFCEEATALPPEGFRTVTAPSREYLDAVARNEASKPAHDAFIASLSNGASEIPRGTEPEPDAPFDPLADMALELAEMAAEDEEPPPPPDDDEVWERRLRLYHANRLWLPDWGPRPGQDGCQAPYELVQGRRR